MSSSFYSQHAIFLPSPLRAARIFQHEIDHINGVLFIDRTDKVWKMEPEEEQEASQTV